MPNEISTTLRTTLTKLESDRANIDHQIAAIRSALGAFSGGALRGAARKATRKSRKAMSPAARKAIGKRMKAYWAKRRAAKAKSSKGSK